MNQTKSNNVDAARGEPKRERRRVPSGRAAVLRRAPSDSDCSGETASLSADSGDRAVRPAPPPPRQGKSRRLHISVNSRRRGSEWEVLEGLKDGQRFEKRPDVFNGYLHKKRKWPLKGWHKRFFVVDGGILVYARSPADVARGRLHGSVDVGLSVISAKARRRRIDIDADEFIYHLRAKTPELFRTWLNVLKTHRLYRQHLLTFGARESVPKIHAPSEDQPATDTSSHTSMASGASVVTKNETNPIYSFNFNNDSSIYSPKVHNSIKIWQQHPKSNDSLERIEQPMTEKMFDVRFNTINGQNHSLCSMNCIDKVTDLLNKKSGNLHKSLEVEQQVVTTEYELTSLDSYLQETMLNQFSLNSNFVKDKKDISPNKSLFIEKLSSTPTNCYFFTRNRPSIDYEYDSEMKRSNKCTNLVKYKNLTSEPPMKMPPSKCMLLAKHKQKSLKSAQLEELEPIKPQIKKMVPSPEKQINISVPTHYTQNKNNVTTRDIIPTDIHTMNELEFQILGSKINKSSQNAMTATEYDAITEKLMETIFQKDEPKEVFKLKYYIDKVVKDLYDIKLDETTHPIKALFKCLLEYWLKNTSLVQYKHALISDKCIDRPSNKYFTKDEYLSRLYFEESTICKSTQVYESKKSKSKNTKFVTNKDPPKYQNPVRDTESYERERRIQELEKLLKSTVYICETQYRDKDIKLTRKLMDNIGKNSKKAGVLYTSKPDQGQVINENSCSSAELPEIQETINNLISETSITKDFAKEFLGAYLDILLEENNTRVESSDSPSSWSDSSHRDIPACDVFAEAVVKKVSKSLSTIHKKKECDESNNNEKLFAGQAGLKDVMDKITTVFSRIKNTEIDNLKPDPVKQTVKINKINKVNSQEHAWLKDKSKEKKDKNQENEIYQLKKINSNCNYIRKKNRNNSLVVNLDKYSLEHITAYNDPVVKGMVSISIKVRERSATKDSKQTNLNIKFADDVKPIITPPKTSDNFISYIREDSRLFFYNLPKSLIHPYITCDLNEEIIELKPYLSTSDATSKGYQCEKSEYSLKASYQSCDSIRKTVIKNNKNITQPCYLLSIKKDSITNNLKRTDKDLEKLNPSTKIIIPSSSVIRSRSKSRNRSPSKTSNRPAKTLTVSRGRPANVTLVKPTHKPTNRPTSVSPNKAKTKPIPNIPLSLKTPDLSLFEKPAPKVIDEKFIILLLEHLTLLSKNIPSLYKDINSFCVKLKKKYEKVLRNCHNAKELSLSGNKYNESYSVNDKTTQITPEPNFDTCNYCKNKGVINNMVDFQTQGTSTETKHSFHTETQTRKEDNRITLQMISPTAHPKAPQASTSGDRRITVTNTESVDIDSIGPTQSPRNFESTTKNYTLDTVIKYVIKEYEMHKKAWSGRQINDRAALKKRQQSIKQQIMKDWLHSPTITVSKTIHSKKHGQDQSKVDKKRYQDKNNERVNVYQLFCSQRFGFKGRSSLTVTQDSGSDDMRTLYRCSSDPSFTSGLLSPGSPPLRGPQAGFVSGTPGGRLAGWIIESGGPLDNATRELGQAQLSVQQLQRLLDALELQQQVHHDTDTALDNHLQCVSLEGASPNVKKDRRKFGLRKKKSNSKCASVELAPPHIDPSSSHTALSALTAPPSPGGGASSIPNSAASLPIACAAARPQSLPSAESMVTIQAGPASLTSLTPDHQLREDFTILAKDLVASLKGIVSTLVCERSRLRAAMEAVDSTAIPNNASVAALRTNLSTALQQNSELRSRLSRIHDASDVAEITDPTQRAFQQSLSYSSSCVSASEFFDAEEHDDDGLKEHIPADETGVIELDGDSSSEAGSLSSEEDVDAGSASSDNSEGAMVSAEAVTLRHSPAAAWTRRTRLPAPRPAPGGPSLWNLLYKNIGKDLSQISMPVTINEPANMLQRLCEELEYSELLDAAAACTSATERMALVAAFAVSAYAASAHRAASKPFNPLLHETYECVRDDRGFRFIAEQVSHHPPISACHAESPSWCFWQEARIKTKFWGKSMEFQPTGRVHVKLHTTGDHYTWNKVTTCVHNLFGGQRWVDQYGDMHINCVGTDISCKLNFIKASSWSATRHEVRGAITTGRGARLRLAGRWSEALHAGDPPAARCLWRPGAMPPEHELYYGFTRFAMELNEMEPGMRDLLPHTDTRLRPDQRALEEGLIDSAEQFKHQLESAQRERRRDPQHPPAWFRKTVEEGEETWVFGGEYWKARAAGFSPAAAPRIW